MRALTCLCAFALAFGTASLEAKQCQLEVSTPQPVLQSGKKQTICLKVGVKGFEMKSEKERSPLNVSLVIDRSSSMTGDKIEQAKEAAIQTLNRLNSKDIVSVVGYDSEVEVLVPATKLTDRASVERKIREIRASGFTALYGGTEAGAKEVRKFLEKEYVNRVILLSDGQANRGPSSVADLAKLGAALGKEGISVTTLGLGQGYNEDLMAKLAATSDGNHTFIEKSEQLASIFQEEFNTALSVVAQEIDCTVKLPEGMRPIRSLNMDVEIKGQEVKFGWNQIYSSHERYMMLEVEIPAFEDGTVRELAQATLSYTNMETKTVDKLSSKVDVRFSSSEVRVKDSINKPVMEEYIELVANENNKKAMKLRDEGKVKEAQELFSSNALYLDENASKLDNSIRLKKSAGMNRRHSDAAASPTWSTDRKGVVREQFRMDAQQSY